MLVSRIETWDKSHRRNALESAFDLHVLGMLDVTVKMLRNHLTES